MGKPQIGELQGALAALEAQDDPSGPISQEESALKSLLWEIYKDYKHRDHVLATFIAVRRRRLLTRLEAARNALEMAVELLAPDERILHDLRRAVALAREHRRQQEAVARYAQTSELEADQQAGLGDEEPAAVPETASEESQKIDHRHVYSDAEALKTQLARFDERVRQIRRAISTGIGWFEEFYIYKTRLTAEARKYIMMKGEEPPEDVQLLEEVRYGPYLKYRWREDGPQIYTMQMGLIPADELKNEEADTDYPWQYL